MPLDPDPDGHDLASRSYVQIDAALRDPATRAVALLPIGSTEPHGPHLPLATDVIISLEAARRAAARLARRGFVPFVAPPIPYAITDFSRDFAGSVGLTRDTSLALVTDVCRALIAQGFAAVCLVNSHLEPEHLAVLREGARRVSLETGRPVVFPDKTLRRWSATLTEEFRSGACHAGRYETSMVMASDPGLVDEAQRRTLPAVEISIGRKIKEGAKTFREAGGDRAYFGDPAGATPEEGEATYEALAAMVETAVIEGLA